MQNRQKLAVLLTYNRAADLRIPVRQRLTMQNMFDRQ
jgi:hypothetical protein